MLSIRRSKSFALLSALDFRCSNHDMKSAPMSTVTTSQKTLNSNHSTTTETKNSTVLSPIQSPITSSRPPSTNTTDRFVPTVNPRPVENIENPLAEDAKRGPRLKLDEMIHKLMNSVSRDPKGNLVVQNHLTDPSTIEQIIARAIPVFKSTKSMLQLHAPIYIVGDLHGQFTDLLRIFEMCGDPKNTSYLFLGDYVDRGPHSLETICLLLCLKIRYPWRINMLRGNHECSAVNRTYGFSDECEDRFQQIPINNTVWGVKPVDMKGSQIWQRFQDVFNWLPFTALIDERILCMHGGLSPNLKSIEQLLNLPRPIDPSEAGLHIDLLWSDPDPAMPCGGKDALWGPSTRGISSHFNSAAVIEACRLLGLDLIVRAHQVVQDGYEFFANRKLVTIFFCSKLLWRVQQFGSYHAFARGTEHRVQGILKPASGTPCKKKGTKSTEVNFDDLDLDSIVSEGENTDEKTPSEKGEIGPEHKVEK
ncbi:Serine/threonine-protein phosphatase [Aphelenchoides besseyi]|nr:Serine/threonine-protein phosphatase [Aphelenchoides besseyi]